MKDAADWLAVRRDVGDRDGNAPGLSSRAAGTKLEGSLGGGMLVRADDGLGDLLRPLVLIRMDPWVHQ